MSFRDHQYLISILYILYIDLRAIIVSIFLLVKITISEFHALFLYPQSSVMKNNSGNIFCLFISYQQIVKEVSNLSE